MREEYGRLGQSLFLFYCTRLLVLVLLFWAAFAYANGYFTHHYDHFPLADAPLPFLRVAHALDLASGAARAISDAAQFAIEQGSTGDASMYCAANQSFWKCRSVILSSLESQLVYSKEGIYTSFQCREGDCAEVSLLWDYFWTFRIRLRFIAYIIVEYTRYGEMESLVAPACSNQTVAFDFSQATAAWALAEQEGVMALSFRGGDNQTATRVTVVFDSAQMAREYSIWPSNFDIPAQSSGFDSSYLTYQLDGVALLGFRSVSSQIEQQSYTFQLVTFVVFACSVVPMLWLLLRAIRGWEDGLFRQMGALDNLYAYQINAIFSGEKPKQSVVLTDAPFTHFYEDLAEAVGRDCEPLLNTAAAVEREETFKFSGLIERVMGKFEESLKPLEEQRGREFANLKPLIRSSISEISESVERRLREVWVRAREVGKRAEFFHFGYLAVLEGTRDYEALLAADRTALPDALLALCRYINHTINSPDLKFAFKFAFAYNHIIEQQIIMRLQDQLLPKYLDALRSLDNADPPYRQRLGLANRLADLELVIENKRHISAVYLK